jgi:hypothetical protein
MFIKFINFKLDYDNGQFIKGSAVQSGKKRRQGRAECKQGFHEGGIVFQHSRIGIPDRRTEEYYPEQTEKQYRQRRCAETVITDGTLADNEQEYRKGEIYFSDCFRFEETKEETENKSYYGFEDNETERQENHIRKKDNAQEGYRI